MFLRLPDGNPDGSGSRFHNHESLLKLRARQIKVIHAIDVSTSYTKAGLLAAVTKLVVLSPTEVENNLGTLVDFTTPTTEPKFLPQGTPVSIELEPPESPNGPGPAHGASRPQRRATPTPSRTQAGLRTRDVRYRSSTTSYS